MHNHLSFCPLLLSLAVIWGAPASAAEMTRAPAVNPCSVTAHQGSMARHSGAAAMNPCGLTANPCGATRASQNASGPTVRLADIMRPAGTGAFAVTARNQRKIVEYGARLWKDTNLSSNGLSCSSCHMQSLAFQQTFASPYPHRVAMVRDRLGSDAPIKAEQMVQFCMLVPMATATLPWDSRELAALATYVKQKEQPRYIAANEQHAMAGNPCSMKANPCAVKSNPCAVKANPCAVKANPCAVKANPCAVKANPCAVHANPCGMAANPCALTSSKGR